jgi:hypothetical protein
MMFGQVFEERFASPIDGFFDLCEKFPLGKPLGNSQPYRSSIISIAQVGLSAMVMVAEDGCWGSAAFVDFFTVTFMDGWWKITNKTFAYTRRDSSGGSKTGLGTHSNPIAIEIKCRAHCTVVVVNMLFASIKSAVPKPSPKVW